MSEDNSLPEPLVPPEVDLRDFGYMPLEVRRLLSSEFWISESADVKCAAVNLWAESWHQVPAASLPDNDRVLARLSGLGQKWRKLRERALYGFVRCSDGLLYHAVVAQKACESWEKKIKQRERTKHATAERARRRNGEHNVERNGEHNVERNEERDEERDVHQGEVEVEVEVYNPPYSPPLQNEGNVTKLRAKEIKTRSSAKKSGWWSSAEATLAKARELGLELRPGESYSVLRSRIRENLAMMHGLFPRSR